MICYRITNLLTGKMYVGVTTTSIEQRFKEHCGAAIRGGKYLLHKSMRKHGIENFVIEEMANAIGTNDILYALEKEIILQEQTEQPKGYNMTSGGENPPSQSGKKPWNKGKKLSSDEKVKLNQTGLALGRGHNKGLKSGPMSEQIKSAISKTTKGKSKPEGFSEKIKLSWEKRRAAKVEANYLLDQLTSIQGKS